MEKRTINYRDNERTKQEDIEQSLDKCVLRVHKVSASFIFSGAAQDCALI